MLSILFAIVAALQIASARVAVPGNWDKPEFCHDKECPEFSNRTRDTPYEVRVYKPTEWAGYRVEGSNFVVAEGKAYTQLTRYFGGANEGDVHIDLSTPAATIFLPSEDYSSANDTFTVLFYLPDATPKPAVDGVFLKKVPSVTGYVRSFGGYATESKILSEAKALKEDLLDNKVIFKDKFFAFATYDSAARLFDRHNEVAFISESPVAGVPAGARHVLHNLYLKAMSVLGF